MPRISRKQLSPLGRSDSEQEILYHVAIYARLSVEDNGKNSDSIESQIEYLESFIANEPSMRKAAVFIDNGYTGTNFMRPEFQRMIDEARAGRINCVVVKDLSRLGRNYVETGEFLEKVCPFLGLRFISVNDNYDSEAISNNSHLAASLSNIINDFYAKDISRKVFSALRTKMENGEYIGAWEKYGYLKDPDNKNRLIVNPETAPIVQQIYLWRSEGMSYLGINKRLNEMGILSPGQYKADRGIVTNNNQKKRTILWNKHIVTDILGDITYIGHMAQRKTTQCLYADIPYSRVDEEDWVIAHNTHEPIISRKLFDKVQEINRASAERARANSGKYDHLPKEKNIYGAKLVCANCGARMKLLRSFSTKKDKVYFSFACPTHDEHGDLGCTCKRKRKADMDEAVFHAIRTQMNVFMDSASVIRSLLAQKQTLNKSVPRKKSRNALNSKLKNLKSSVSALYVDMKDGLLNEEEYLLQKEKYQAQIAELEHTLDELDCNKAETEEQLIGTKNWAAIVAEHSEATELTEGMLSACVERIQVHSDGFLEITFNYKQEFEELLETTKRLKKEVA